MSHKLNLLVTLNENYLPQLNVMLYSLLRSNGDCSFDVYLLHSSIPEAALTRTRKILGDKGRLCPVQVKELRLTDAPTTDRYPQEIYYRIFAARFLPRELERVLYLDPDLIINGSLLPLYGTDMSNYYFAAASHVGTLILKFNDLRLDMDESAPYINSGVMLMNLELLRREQNEADVFRFMQERKGLLILPDQDIISGLYGRRIYTLDPFRYNMTERLFQAHVPFDRDLNLDWVRENSVIIHYCGRNKPWKKHYLGQLDVFYLEAEGRLEAELAEEGRAKDADRGKV